MAIETYRTIRVVAGHANETIAPIRLSADDHDGRSILFELWDGASAAPSSGLNAKMLYTTADGTGGYTNLTTTTSNGTAAFTGPFPTEIFAQRRGALAVAVSSGSDVIATLRVPFEVDEAIIDEDSPEAQDALSEFRAAVAQLDQLLPATTTRLGTVKVGDGLTAAGDGTLSVAPASLPSAVPIAKGGTGQTTAKAAQYALTNTAAEQTAAAADDTYVLTAHTSASAANGFVAKRKLSNLWTYIKSKIDGSAIAPASVAATGAVSGSSISDSGGTLAALRDSVSQVVVRSAPGPSSATAKEQVDAASIGTTYIWGAYSSAAYSPTGAAGNWAYILHVPQIAGVTYSIFFAKAQSHAYIYSYSQDAWTQIV